MSRAALRRCLDRVIEEKKTHSNRTIMDMFIGALGLLIIICVLTHLYTRQVQQQIKDNHFRQFQRSYLVVYLLAIAGDWLQGPHVYALYESYQISKHEIEVLFIAGFGSSMIFGTIVASLADKYGRRNTCLMYGILYGISCVTKVRSIGIAIAQNFECLSLFQHFPNFQILFIGRLLAGMATSILFSAFESWLINEHRRVSEEQRMMEGKRFFISARFRWRNLRHNLCQCLFRQFGRCYSLGYCGSMVSESFWIRVSDERMRKKKR